MDVQYWTHTIVNLYPNFDSPRVPTITTLPSSSNFAQIHATRSTAPPFITLTQLSTQTNTQITINTF